MAEVFLRHLSRWQAEQQQEELADEFIETYRRAHGAEYDDRQAFLKAFNRAFTRDGFDMVVAGAAGRTAGHAYGYLIDRSGGWWRGLGSDEPWDVEELTVSGQVFALAELTVRPPFRRTGVAGRLLDALLTRTDAALAVTRVDPANAGALAALRSWGWVRLGTAGADDTQVPSVGTGRATEIWGRALRA
ncbi:GNAT family N-acetyltransferase [Streptomyces sp. NRRL F-5126]|uniref:GNAT family N-acetyltransferase n=1 Tax=Streptomyces sp. NRRL F-5126 TaxID=1463857 RepID=UPI00068DE892|nr:GNAT family N-acetyltransferase [Streptomyces sp. NRRL F-5126]